MGTNNNPTTNQQDHPHREGQTMNTTPQQQGSGQRVSENKSQGMSDIMNESEEQRSGSGHDQQNEQDGQKEQWRP